MTGVKCLNRSYTKNRLQSLENVMNGLIEWYVKVMKRIFTCMRGQGFYILY